MQECKTVGHGIPLDTEVLISLPQSLFFSLQYPVVFFFSPVSTQRPSKYIYV